MKVADEPLQIVCADGWVLITGAELTTKVCEPEVPPPGAGLKTVMLLFAEEEISDAVIVASKVVELIKVVVRLLPLNFTTDEALKLVPLTVKVKSEPPVSLQTGEMLVSVGVGLFTVNELLVPLSLPAVLVAVMVKVPPGEMATL